MVGQSDGTISVPADAVAVVVNVTYVDAFGPGYITLFPAGTTRPNSSNLNKVGVGPVPNLVTVKLGDAGAVSIYNNQSATQLVGDLAGYYVLADLSGQTGPTGATGVAGVTGAQGLEKPGSQSLDAGGRHRFFRRRFFLLGMAGRPGLIGRRTC